MFEGNEPESTEETGGETIGPGHYGPPESTPSAAHGTPEISDVDQEQGQTTQPSAEDDVGVPADPEPDPEEIDLPADPHPDQ
jgi:hypothetical protein